VAVDLLHDAAGDLHEVGDAELHRRDPARIEAAAEADDALVGALAGDIDAHDQGRRRVRGERARHGLVDALAVDELQRAGAGKARKIVDPGSYPVAGFALAGEPVRPPDEGLRTIVTSTRSATRRWASQRQQLLVKQSVYLNR
jgi:hypothetical protein